MYMQLDKKHKTIDFFSEGEWIEGLPYEDTALFIAEVTKILSEAREYENETN